MSLVRHRVPLPGGDLQLLQPTEAAELPDDGAIEWAPVAPYWSVLWRSGVPLAREVASARLRGSRVVELGSGLADPGRPAAGAFLDQARQRWRVTTTVRDGVEIHRLARAPPR